MPTFNFETIGFNPSTGELSIKDINDNHVIIQEEPLIKSPFNLSTTGVKLKDINQTTGTIDFSEGTTFATKKFELKLKWKGNKYNANMNFGALQTNIGEAPIAPGTIVGESFFHLLWIGSDDIRVNNSRPSGILLLEGGTVFFKIVTEENIKYLIIKYDY
jgi:hypothetical protein